MSATCGTCVHFMDDGEEIERALPAILILSSGHGETRGDQGICRIHDQWLLPRMSCSRYQGQGPSAQGGGR